MNNSEFSRQLKAMYDMADRAFQEHKEHLDALAASHKEVQDAHDMCELTVSNGNEELQQKLVAFLEERLQDAWADCVSKHEAHLNFLKSPKFADEAIRPYELALEKLRESWEVLLAEDKPNSSAANAEFPGGTENDNHD